VGVPTFAAPGVTCGAVALPIGGGATGDVGVTGPPEGLFPESPPPTEGFEPPVGALAPVGALPVETLSPVGALPVETLPLPGADDCAIAAGYSSKSSPASASEARPKPNENFIRQYRRRAPCRHGDNPLTPSSGNDNP
jgi:hypothetical protein